MRFLEKLLSLETRVWGMIKKIQKPKAILAGGESEYEYEGNGGFACFDDKGQGN